MYKLIIGLLFSGLFLSGCETNPVTGKRQLSLVSGAQEINIGRQQYGPSKQSQGGVYTVDPTLNGYVNRVGQRLAALSDRPNLPYEFVVLNSDTPNAWALPGGKIAINRGLLILLEDEAQLAAVLGHEVVHAAARHGASQMSQGMLLQLGTQIAGQASGSREIAQLAGIGAAAFQARYGRDQELESDHYGMKYMLKAGYEPQAAVELQQTFLMLSQKRGAQQGGFNALFASHPPSAERVRKNQQLANRMPKGKRNKTQYQRAIRQLKRDQGAYKSHGKALSLTNRAIKQQPREARFHLTRGLLNKQAKNNKQALASFNRAVSLDPTYFLPLLQRGLINYDMSRYQSAQTDLSSSNKFLATAPAYFYLGEIALKQRQRNNAASYYRKASQGSGEIAKAAASRLRQLGIR